MYSKNLKSKAEINQKQKRKNDGCLLVEASFFLSLAQNLLVRSGLDLITDCGVHARASAYTSTTSYDDPSARQPKKRFKTALKNVSNFRLAVT